MRLISFGIVGLLVITVILFPQSLQIEREVAFQNAEYYIEKAVQHAAQDAVTALKSSAETYAKSDRILTVEQPLAGVENFMVSLANSLNMTSHEDLIRLSSYIPYIAIIDQKGYYIYAMVQVAGRPNTYLRQLLPRIDFMHQIGDYYIFLGDSDQVKVLYRKDSLWQVNYKSRAVWAVTAEDGAVRQFFAAPHYEQRVANLKRIQLESDLAQIVNAHNAYARARGIYYDFTFAPIGDSWNGVVERPSIVTALQGLPITKSRTYNAATVYHFALGLDKPYCGFVKNGVKYYAAKANLPVAEMHIEEVFSSAQDAAKSGYYPYHD